MSEEDGWQRVGHRERRTGRARKIKSKQKLEFPQGESKQAAEEVLPFDVVAAPDEGIRKGNKLIASGKRKEGVEELRRVTQKHLADVVMSCWDLVAKVKLDTALDLVEKALSADKKFVPALEVKVFILRKLERYEEVLNTIDAFEPFGKLFNYEKIFSLMKLGRKDMAIDFIGRTIEFQDPAASCLSCGLMFSTGQVLEAIKIFDKNRAFAAETGARTDPGKWLNWLLSGFGSQTTPAETAFKIKILVELGRYETALFELEQLSQGFSKLLCDHDNKEEISVVESVLRKFYLSPVSTPFTFQFCYYRRVVGTVRPELPFDLGELISAFASESCVYDLKEGDLAYVDELGWPQSLIVKSTFDEICIRYDDATCEWMSKDSFIFAVISPASPRQECLLSRLESCARRQDSLLKTLTSK